MTRPPEHRDLIGEVEHLRQRVERIEARTRTATITKSFVIVGDFDEDLYVPPIFVAPDPDSVGDQGLDLRGVFSFIRAGTVNFQLMRAPVESQGTDFGGITLTYGDEQFVGVGSATAGSPPGTWTGTGRGDDLTFGDRFFLDLTSSGGASDLTVSLIFDHTPR